MTDSKLIDSSVWISYIAKGNNSELIDSETNLLTSSVSLFEIKKKLLGDKIEISKINKNIEMIKNKASVVDISAEIAENAAELSIKNKLPAIYSLIYSSAIHYGSELITMDNDFRGLKDVKILN